MKCTISLPEPSIMPNTVSSGRGAPILLMCGPSSWASNGGPGREKVHRFGTGGKKRIDARGIETGAGLMPQVGPRLIGRFDNAPVARQRGAGNPEPAAGPRGGAAEPRLLLDNEDVDPVMPGGNRRR